MTSPERIDLPHRLVSWAEGEGFTDLQIYASPIALSVEIELIENNNRLPRNLHHIVSTLRVAAEHASTSWPIVVLVDVHRLENEEETSARNTLWKLANDPTWHRGDCSLYTTPLIFPPQASAFLEWKGETSRKGLRKLLLDKAAIPDAPEAKPLGLVELGGRLAKSSLDSTLRDRLVSACADQTGEGKAQHLVDVVEAWRVDVREGRA